MPGTRARVSAARVGSSSRSWHRDMRASIDQLRRFATARGLIASGPAEEMRWLSSFGFPRESLERVGGLQLSDAQRAVDDVAGATEERVAPVAVEIAARLEHEVATAGGGVAVGVVEERVAGEAGAVE